MSAAEALTRALISSDNAVRAPVMSAHRARSSAVIHFKARYLGTRRPSLDVEPGLIA